MGDFGSDLKMEREKSGISLEQIAQSTKVSVRHLRALEDQRFDQLPGGIFNRGILRGYLRYLHLDEDPWIARFASVYQPAATDKEHENEWLSYAEKATGVKPSPAGADQLRFRWIGIALLFLILAIAGWFVLRFVRHRAAHAPAAAANSRYSLPTPVHAPNLAL
jgi:cytoskeleton protein RodZ